MQMVNFRYSDTDFISYLVTIGYEYNKIEITRDRSGKLRAFVYFEGDKTKLIEMYNEFKNKRTKIDPYQYSLNRKSISKLIKSEILKYQAERII